MDHNELFKILKENDEKLIKKIIDENILIKNYDNRKLIHYICRYSKNNKIIKYIIDKNLNLEEEPMYKSKPIHLICINQDEEMIKYIIDKNVSLNDNNNFNKNPLIIYVPELIKANYQKIYYIFLLIMVLNMNIYLKSLKI